jgi:uncharacterized protein YkwD
MKKNLKKILLISGIVLISVLLVFTLAPTTNKNINVLGKAIKTNQAPTGTVVSKEASLTDYENAIAALINNVREQNGLNALAADDSLTEVARQRSQDLINRNYFSHYTPEGTNVFDLMRSMGISFRYAGENLAQSSPASIGSPEAFLNAWLNSPSHKANILRPQYTKIGVGMVEIDSRRVVTTVFSN